MLETASTPRETLPEVGPTSRSVSVRAGMPAGPGEIAFPEHRAGDERLLAGARVGAALALVLATVTDLHDSYGPAIDVLVLAFAIHATLILFLTWKTPEWLVRRSGALHAIDLVWAMVATSVSGGIHSHVFLFFTYVLAASALRWGLAGALRDGGIVLVVACLQGAAAATGWTRWPFEVDLFLLRVSFAVVGVAVLFGIVSERQLALRFQAVALADLVTSVGRAGRLTVAVREMLMRVLRIFGARHAFLFIEEHDTSLMFLWHAELAPDGEIRTSFTPLGRETRPQWLESGGCEGPACELRRVGGGHTWTSVALRTDLGGRVGPATCAPPAGMLVAAPWTTMLTARIDFERLWRGTVYIFDPIRRPHGAARLRFLHRLAQEVGPALLNLYLVRRLRSRAEAHERGRISRELHDSVLQALAGLEMRLDVVRRRAERLAPVLTADLSEIRDLLHDQALAARELMQRLSNSDVDAARLHGALGDVVDRFAQMAGISAGLDWSVDRLELSPHECSEIVRIVQEALFNVRRHSGAARVRVRVESDACVWALIVEDNGCGLGYTGRLSHEQLQAQEKGPRVIRERVAALGGTLDAESSSGGTRLEMTFPHYNTDYR